VPRKCNWAQQKGKEKEKIFIIFFSLRFDSASILFFLKQKYFCKRSFNLLIENLRWITCNQAEYKLKEKYFIRSSEAYALIYEPISIIPLLIRKFIY